MPRKPPRKITDEMLDVARDLIAAGVTMREAAGFAPQRLGLSGSALLPALFGPITSTRPLVPSGNSASTYARKFEIFSSLRCM
jgi:hypothetical protein